MLSNEEIQSVAEAHFQGHCQVPAVDGAAGTPLQLRREFDLEEPSGAYYGVTIDLDQGIILGGRLGFFVHRKDGTVSHFGPEDFVRAFRALSLGPQHGQWYMVETTPSVISFLLSDPLSHSQSSHEPEARMTKPRKWWRIWP